MDFTVCKFKDLIDYKSGYTWSKEQESTKCLDGSVRVLTVTNIQEKLDLSSKLYLLKVSQKDRERKAVSEGWSIAVSSNGNRKRIGNAVFVEGNTDYLFASFLIAFRPKDFHVILPKYFFYWFSSQPIQERISSVSEGTTGLGNLDIRFLRNMDIHYPKKISEQQAIVDILSKLDEAIEAVEKSNHSTERLKKSLMQNILTGKLQPDGTWRSGDDFYIDDKLGKVPKGWKVQPLKEISDFYQYGLNINSSEDAKIPMFRMNNIIEGKMVDSPMVYVNLSEANLEKYKVEKGDILFNRTNSMDLVGKLGIFELEGEYVFASYLIRVRINKDNDPYFVNFFLNSYKGQTSLRSKATPSVSQANINAKNLVNTFVPVPPLETQLEISEIIKNQDQLKMEHRCKLLTLKKLKKSLMQNLLTGKFRVDADKINKLLDKA